MIDGLDPYAPVFNFRVRCSCGLETLVAWDTNELDYLPLTTGWLWSADALYTCGAPGHRQASSEPILA